MGKASQFLLALALLLLGGSGDPQSSLLEGCRHKASNAEFNRCLEKIAGLSPIDVLAAPRSTTIRALITTHETTPEFWIQFGRREREAPSLQVQSLLYPRFSVRLALTQAKWDELRRIVLNPKLKGAKESPGVSKEADGSLRVCIAVGAALFEVVDDKRVSRFSVNGCQSEIDLVNDFISRVTETIPECDSIPKESSGDEILRLENCSRRAAGLKLLGVSNP